MPMPIDPNTEIMRVTIAERIQQISDRASLLGQIRQSMSEEQHRVVAETQVKETQQKSEQVETELKRKNPFVGRRRKATEEKSGQAAPEENFEIIDEKKEGGFHLDIQA